VSAPADRRGSTFHVGGRGRSRLISALIAGRGAQPAAQNAAAFGAGHRREALAVQRIDGHPGWPPPRARGSLSGSSVIWSGGQPRIGPSSPSSAPFAACYVNGLVTRRPSTSKPGRSSE
jgi:hypothetical protein